MSSCREWESCLNVCCLQPVSQRYSTSHTETDTEIDLFSILHKVSFVQMFEVLSDLSKRFVLLFLAFVVLFDVIEAA